ncbi:MAG TPA: Rpn family recombination-promoting nuclease/putative transposase [Chitinispirillaceae bacterium]|nr:Rpn family recombination-promoting nuclease/putative transposase [Chitinispirillaceae bacterium]
MARKLVSFDWAIKRLLRSKANFGVLEGFLSELLHTDITILEILDSESNKDEVDAKSNRVDIKVKDAGNCIILIEIQYSRELDYLQRVLFGTSKAIVEHMSESSAYSDVVKVISVNILYFRFGTEDDYIYHGTTTFRGIHSHSILELNEAQKKLYSHQKVADIYPEYYLINVNNFNDTAKDTLDEWIYFLKNEKIEDTFNARGLKDASETLDILKMGEKERAAYEKYCDQLRYEASMYESTYVTGRVEGRVEGRAEGRAEGREEGAIEKAYNSAEIMMRNGESDEKIALYTDLTIELVRELRKKLGL